mgnify:CR=1 FL=1
MCRAIEEMREETAREATHAKAVAVAQMLLKIGKMSYEEIALSVKLPVEEIKALDTQKSA